jgi:hypothetical protein
MFNTLFIFSFFSWIDLDLFSVPGNSSSASSDVVRDVSSSAFDDSLSENSMSNKSSLRSFNSLGLFFKFVNLCYCFLNDLSGWLVNWNFLNEWLLDSLRIKFSRFDSLFNRTLVLDCLSSIDDGLNL